MNITSSELWNTGFVFTLSREMRWLQKEKKSQASLIFVLHFMLFFHCISRIHQIRLLVFIWFCLLDFFTFYLYLSFWIYSIFLWLPLLSFVWFNVFFQLFVIVLEFFILPSFLCSFIALSYFTRTQDLESSYSLWRVFHWIRETQSK